MAQAQKNTLKNVNAPETASEPHTAPQSDTGSIRSGTSLFDLLNAEEGQTGVQKSAFMSRIRQRLAEVADAAKRSGEEATETENLAASAATELFLARKAGKLSGDELTGVLGDIFGYKPKADGTPGKQPDGAGRTIKMRIVRALQGWDFVNGGDGGRFFETMDAADVAPVINSIGRVKEVEHTDPQTGVVSKEVVPDGPTVWSAYKLLGDLKSQSTVRVEMAFDPKKIAALGDKLIEAGARDKLLSNPSLIKAYKYLADQITAVSQVSEGELEAVKARLGLVSNDEPEVENEGGEQVAA